MVKFQSVNINGILDIYNAINIFDIYTAMNNVFDIYFLRDHPGRVQGCGSVC